MSGDRAVPKLLPLVAITAAASIIVLRRSCLRRELHSRYEQLSRIIAFVPTSVRAVEWDYAGLVQLIAAWCDRAARHHAEHRFFYGWKRTARELQWAAALCRRVIDPPYLSTLGYNIEYAFGLEPRGVRLRNAGISRIAEAQREADFAELVRLLRRKLRTWWD
jgi:hypothetical protein